MPTDKYVDNTLKELRKSFAATSADLWMMISCFHDEMRHGLSGESSSLKMLPAYIDCPGRQEKGTYLGIDMGGTNLRVLLVRLQGDGKTVIEDSKQYKIPRKVAMGEGKDLFDFVAKAICEFVGEYPITHQNKIPLGFTFSFPVKQTALNRGTLVEWTKGFAAGDVVGRDVVEFLNGSLQRCSLKNLRLAALTNDTVGTMLAKAYGSSDCDMGVIFGTGTNACYREQEKRIARLMHSDAGKRMIVNIEWGNFKHFPANKYDRKVDKGSNNPGVQQLEKMISGLYLCEITRHVVRDLIGKGIFLNDHVAKFRKGKLSTEDMAAFERDRSPELKKVGIFLTEQGIESSLEERKIIKQICRIVSRRAARISGAAISAVIIWMDPELRQDHTVAVDGTLYAKYPQFRQNIIKTLQQLHGAKSNRIKLSDARDGSGVGAAVAAAVAVEAN